MLEAWKAVGSNLPVLSMVQIPAATVVTLSKALNPKSPYKGDWP